MYNLLIFIHKNSIFYLYNYLFKILLLLNYLVFNDIYKILFRNGDNQYGSQWLKKNILVAKSCVISNSCFILQGQSP